MQVLVPGIEYLLDTSDKDPNAKPHHLKFCHKDSEGKFVHGLTTEEILKMLIHRYGKLVEKDASTDNIQTLLHLKRAHEAATNRNYNKLKRQRSAHDSTGNGIPVQAPGQ